VSWTMLCGGPADRSGQAKHHRKAESGCKRRLTWCAFSGIMDLALRAGVAQW
jgi:hypothetical protein